MGEKRLPSVGLPLVELLAGGALRILFGSTAGTEHLTAGGHLGQRGCCSCRHRRPYRWCLGSSNGRRGPCSVRGRGCSLLLHLSVLRLRLLLLASSSGLLLLLLASLLCRLGGGLLRDLLLLHVLHILPHTRRNSHWHHDGVGCSAVWRKSARLPGVVLAVHLCSAHSNSAIKAWVHAHVAARLVRLREALLEHAHAPCMLLRAAGECGAALHAPCHHPIFAPVQLIR
mmetsp:Transcript_34642/g.85235  ORF Transcript_34642/g.85235 Transcript_34642/m.85235 type:complete len:228 (+) Transcript_34642:606-1289(+)